MKTILTLPLVIALSAGVLASCTLTKETTSSSSTPTQETTEVKQAEGSMQYRDYSSEAVAQMQGKPYALFFHATWCPSCVRADKDIKANLSSLGEDTMIFKVDYDSNMELRKKYGVTSQHTIVFIGADGQVTGKKMGFEVADIKAGFEASSISAPAVETSTNNSTAQYREYNTETLAQLEGKPYVLFFHANWCSWCRRMDRDLTTELGNLPKNTIVIKANFDKEEELRKKYNITTKDTYVFINEKGEATNKSGATLDDIKEFFEKKTVNQSITTNPTGYGMYKPYNAEIEKTFQGKKPYALFFHATWCPACRQADSEIQANLSSLPASTAIFQVDYDSNAELRKKYGVTSQHTIVFIGADGEVTSKVMGFGLDDIKNNF